MMIGVHQGVDDDPFRSFATCFLQVTLNKGSVQGLLNSATGGVRVFTYGTPAWSSWRGVCVYSLRFIEFGETQCSRNTRPNSAISHSGSWLRLQRLSRRHVRHSIRLRIAHERFVLCKPGGLRRHRRPLPYLLSQVLVLSSQL